MFFFCFFAFGVKHSRSVTHRETNKSCKFLQSYSYMGENNTWQTAEIVLLVNTRGYMFDSAHIESQVSGEILFRGVIYGFVRVTGACYPGCN